MRIVCAIGQEYMALALGKAMSAPRGPADRRERLAIQLRRDNTDVAGVPANHSGHLPRGMRFAFCYRAHPAYRLLVMFFEKLR